MKRIIYTILGLLVIGAAVLWLRGSQNDWICADGQWVKQGNPPTSRPTEPCGPEQKIVENFQDCLAAGYPVLESYPRQCQADGVTYFEDIGNELEKSELIRLDSPRPNDTITSPLTIRGEARGTWFFEADFPVVLVNWDGLIIATGAAQAQGEWMTEDFVPFSVELEFSNPIFPDVAPGHFSERGALILQKDNPSGLAEYDDALEIPLYFSK